MLQNQDKTGRTIAPHLRLPIKGLDQRSTQVEMPMVSPIVVQPYFIADSFVVYDQETWMLPALPSHFTTLSPTKSRSINEAEKSSGYAIQLQKLLKSSGVYALSSLATPMVALVLAPFLTRTLSHTEYGVLSIMNTAVALIAGLTQFGLGSAFFRSYNYDYEDAKDRSGVLSTVIILLLLISLPVIITITAIANQLSVLLFNDASFSDIIRVGGLVVLLQNLTVPGFAWLRAENRPAFFSILSITNLVVSLVATLFFVGMLHMQVIGTLLATGAGYTTVVICILPIILIRVGFRLRLDIAKGLLSFGLPNVSNFVSVWVLQLSDRYLLGLLGSLAQAASYSLAYNLGGVLGVIVLAPFNLAWPSAMFTIAKRDNAPLVFQLVFRWFGFALLFAAFSLSILSTIALHLFFPAAYFSAASIIPIIAMSIMFYGIYNIFMTGVSIRKKTWFAVLLTTLSAIINVLLNLFLIPWYSAFGAAASTLISYMLLAIGAYIINQRLYSIPFEIGRFIIAFLIGVALYVGCDILVAPLDTITAYGVYVIVLVFYASCLLLLGKFPALKSK